MRQHKLLHGCIIENLYCPFTPHKLNMKDGLKPLTDLIFSDLSSTVDFIPTVQCITSNSLFDTDWQTPHTIHIVFFTGDGDTIKRSIVHATPAHCTHDANKNGYCNVRVM